MSKKAKPAGVIVNDQPASVSEVEKRMNAAIDHFQFRYPIGMQLLVKLQEAGLQVSLAPGYGESRIPFLSKCETHRCVAVDKQDKQCLDGASGYSGGMYVGTQHSLTWWLPTQQWVRFCSNHGEGYRAASLSVRAGVEDWRPDCRWIEVRDVG